MTEMFAESRLNDLGFLLVKNTKDNSGKFWKFRVAHPTKGNRYFDNLRDLRVWIERQERKAFCLV